MTAGEVAQALQWQEDEETRLTRIAAPCEKIAEDLERGKEPDITAAQWREGVDALAAAAAEKNAAADAAPLCRHAHDPAPAQLNERTDRTRRAPAL